MKMLRILLVAFVPLLVSNAIFAAPSLKMPFPAGELWTMTRGYNQDTHRNYSNPTTQDKLALDFVLPGCEAYGKPVFAVANGVVEFAGLSGGYGNTVVLNHGDGYKSRSAHLSEINVQVNAVVSQGQEIGKMGNSGNVEGAACKSYPGTHLHFVMYYNGQAFKPEPMSGYTNIGDINGALFLSDNYRSNQVNVDTYCKGMSPNYLVERFRSSNGNLVVNACPSDGRVYFYKDISYGSCNLGYVDLFANTDGTGGYQLCTGSTSGIPGENYGTEPIIGTGGSDPGGGSVAPPPATEPRNDLVPHVNAYAVINGREVQVTADSLTGPTLPVTEGQVLRVEQIMDSKYSDASKWFRETFHSIYTTAWYQVVTADKKTVVVPWTEIFTRKFDPGRLEKGESYGESTNFTVLSGYPNHYLVIASCADPTDRVLEKGESTTRKSPATNPEQCGTNNITRKEWLWINPKPRSVDYIIENAGIINAPDYLFIEKPYRLWYEGVNLGPDASTDRIAVSIKLISPNGTRTTLLARSIEPANLTPNAVYLDQPTDILTTPTVPGAYWFEFCINTEGKLETNTGNNCFLYRKEVRDPNVPDTIGMYRCPSIRSDTWAAWSNQPYAPPFTADGKLFFTPWCLDSNSAYLQIFVTGSGTKWVHETIYVRNGVNGTEISLPAMCSEAKSGSWCPGVARLFIQSTSIDTSVPEKPTLILAYVCDWNGTAWKCAYTQQAATKAARQ